jgi:ribosomal protein L11 methyltransferase
MGKPLWLIALTAPDLAAAQAAAAAFDDVADTVSVFEAGTAWRVEGLSLARPGRAALETRLALAFAGRGGEPPALAVDRLAARDWVSENQAGFPPVEVAGFFIHGTHHRNAVPAGRIGLTIDAATAFGTGEHASTRGCLIALAGMARRRKTLDMGTGTGILAIAAAKRWRRRVEARDIDGEAVRVGRRNAAVNQVTPLVAARRGSSFDERALRRCGPFDLILANILARPLILMARGLVRSLQPGGVTVLSGLLARQENSVLAAYRRLGMRLHRRIPLEGWSILVLARGSPFHRSESS